MNDTKPRSTPITLIVAAIATLAVGWTICAVLDIIVDAQVAAAEFKG